MSNLFQHQNAMIMIYVGRAKQKQKELYKVSQKKQKKKKITLGLYDVAGVSSTSLNQFKIINVAVAAVEYSKKHVL